MCRVWGLLAWVYGMGWSWTPLSFTWICYALPFYSLLARPPRFGLMAVSVVACPQGGRSAAAFDPLENPPTPYTYELGVRVDEAVILTVKVTTRCAHVGVRMCGPEQEKKQITPPQDTWSP
jgi:hypothetical protein